MKCTQVADLASSEITFTSLQPGDFGRQARRSKPEICIRHRRKRFARNLHQVLASVSYVGEYDGSQFVRRTRRNGRFCGRKPTKVAGRIARKYHPQWFAV